MKSFINVFKTKTGGIGFVRAKTFLDKKGAKLIQLKASLKGVKLGESEVFIGSQKGKVASVLDVYVEKQARKQGISSALFKNALKQSKAHGAEFLSSDQIISPYQVLIRSKYRTKFIKRSDSGYSFASPDEAIKDLSNAKPTAKISAVTKIPDQKIVFKKIRGRIIPIRKSK